MSETVTMDVKPSLKVRFGRGFYLRLRIAVFLMWLAAKVSGADLEMTFDLGLADEERTDQR